MPVDRGDNTDRTPSYTEPSIDDLQNERITIPITYGPNDSGSESTTVWSPVTIEAIENPDKATVARLENYDSGRLFLTVFRDGEFSHFGPVCSGVRSHRVDQGKSFFNYIFDQIKFRCTQQALSGAWFRA